MTSKKTDFIRNTSQPSESPLSSSPYIKDIGPDLIKYLPGIAG